MPIFITGGTGFLGINLVRLLVERGERVRLLVRREPSRLGLESDLIEFVRGDVTNADSIREGMRGCDRVYHLAGWVQVSPWGWETARAVNVEGTRNVCAAAMAAGVSRVVHTSSIATTACGTLADPANEESAPEEAVQGIPYYRTKLEAETVVLEHVERGLDAVIVNPTYILGPWDMRPTSGRMLIHMATHPLWFAPRRGGINCVDVRQAAAGHVLAMEQGACGRRYLLGGENLSFRTLADRVAAIAKPRPCVSLPYSFLYPFAAGGSLAGRLFPTLFRDINLCVLRAAFCEHYVRSDRARDELGYEVTSINAAIEDALRWFVEHGYMKRAAWCD